MLEEYAEKLPPLCPPDAADDIEHEEIYRFLTGGSVKKDHFSSHAALGKPNRLKADGCSFASCSLLSDWEKYLENIPNMRRAHSHVARLKIPVGVGKSKGKAKNGAIHYDFWCYAGQDLTKYVVDVTAIPPASDDNA